VVISLEHGADCLHTQVVLEKRPLNWCSNSSSLFPFPGVFYMVRSFHAGRTVRFVSCSFF